MNITAFLLVVCASLTAQAEPSLFRQTAEQVRQSGRFACNEVALAEKVYGQEHRCGSTIDEWKQYAAQLIDVPRRRPSRTHALQTVVYRNTLITQYYAHLYSMSAKRFPQCGRSLLPWVGGASLGSLKSGQVMRSGLSAVVGGLTEFDRFEDGNYHGRFGDLLGPLSTLGLEQATLTLGEGNREIFKDLFWQLLAGATCGPKAVVDMIEKDPRGLTDPKLKRSLQSWVLLAKAETTCDPKTVIEANKGFVEVEQYLVGQPIMYEGLTQSIGGRVLTPIVEAAVPSALGTFPMFIDHAKQTRSVFFANFADADQRVSWMKDQLEVMENEFNAKRTDVTEPLFCAVIRESESARFYLETLQKTWPSLLEAEVAEITSH